MGQSGKREEKQWRTSMSSRVRRDGQRAAISTLFIALLAVAALAAFAVWEDWFTLIAGLWLIGLPWLLGFEDSDTITICVVTGSIVAALAASKVRLVRLGDRWITLDN